MANFLLTERGAAGTILEAEWTGLATGSELSTGRLPVGPWDVHWSVGARAPRSTWQEGDAGALVIGDAVDGARGSLDAEAVARRVLASTDPESWALDGYFLAIVCDGERAVVLSDVLGLFPVYRGTGSPLYASSIPLGVDGSLDPQGLAGLLEFHGPVGGRLIIPGVRRVRSGHALVLTPTEAREESVFVWPAEEVLASKPVEEQDALLHEAFTQALDAQLPPSGEVGLLLTGGRDSRTLAGRLAQLGRTVHARTVGQPADHDATLAARVAERLEQRHSIAPLPEDAFVAGMDRHLELDHFGTGASQCWWRGAGTALDELPERSVTGHVHDVIVGGMLRPTGVSEFGMDIPWEFARPFERRFGVSDGVLESLKDPAVGEGVAWADETMHHAYLALPTVHRVWRWVLDHFVRFQVGMVLQPISRYTWPIVPVLDRALIRVAAQLDSRHFGARQGQDRMLRRYYPDMATIAHTVENASPGTPLTPSMVDQMRDRLFGRARRPGPVAWRGDRRFVWRNTDFFNPGWSALRERAEPLRTRLHDVVEPAALDAYLPPPGGPLTRVDFAAHQGPKLLVGLALWLERYG
ncbi:MAG: asparagine synthase-related protein [Gemmatimonadota bacterium]